MLAIGDANFCVNSNYLMRFIVGENGPSKRPRLALCASLGWFADFNEIH